MITIRIIVVKSLVIDIIYHHCHHHHRRQHHHHHFNYINLYHHQMKSQILLSTPLIYMKSWAYYGMHQKLKLKMLIGLQLVGIIRIGSMCYVMCVYIYICVSSINYYIYPSFYLSMCIIRIGSMCCVYLRNDNLYDNLPQKR